jgi:hypothetical protein
MTKNAALADMMMPHATVMFLHSIHDISLPDLIHRHSSFPEYMAYKILFIQTFCTAMIP